MQLWKGARKGVPYISSFLIPIGGIHNLLFFFLQNIPPTVEKGGLSGMRCKGVSLCECALWAVKSFKELEEKSSVILFFESFRKKGVCHLEVSQPFGTLWKYKKRILKMSTYAHLWSLSHNGIYYYTKFCIGNLGF